MDKQNSKDADQQNLMARALSEIKRLQQKIKDFETEKNEPIAIVSYSCRFPGGIKDGETFWSLLREGRDAITEVPNDRWDREYFYDKDTQKKGKMYCKRGGFLSDVSNFDASFFGITPVEANRMDPQQRLLLELSWEALENGSYNPQNLIGSKTGVFVGLSGNDYLQLQTREEGFEDIDPYVTTGWSHSVAAGRVSFHYGFEGPSMAIDTACSSALVAVDLACLNLRSGSCDMALAGGVSLMLSPEVSINFSKAKMLSVDGVCKTFDATANGYVRGEGGGLVLLKRLSDAIRDKDNVVAVIAGSAVNQDGKSSGLTVPNGPAQERVIRDALKIAKISTSEVSYIEAHGTGTSLGDPIEANALLNVFGEGRKAPLLVGSVKTNLGHLEAAAGISSLLKAVLCIENKTLVPSLHFKTLNPYIDNSAQQLEVVTQTKPWKVENQKLVAGVSSFGFSGTNAHLVLTEFINNENSPEKTDRALENDIFILPLSGHTKQAVIDKARIFSERLSRSEVSIVEFLAVATKNQPQFKFRTFVTGDSKSALLNALNALSEEKIKENSTIDINKLKNVFMYTGQGSQYPKMGKYLYQRYGVFKNAFDECANLFERFLGINILEVVFGENSNHEILSDTIHTQPALFAFEYSYTQLWLQYGIKPEIVLGHSIGEIVAACVAGVFDLKDAAQLVSARAKAIKQVNLDGAMIAIALNEIQTKELISEYNNLSIAAINALESCVVSGATPEINQLEIKCRSKNIRCKKLNVSQPFHSKLLSSAIRNFRRDIEGITFHLPKIKIISNINGKLVTASEISNPDYWCQHILSPVRFYDSVLTLNSLNINSYIEIGPSPILTELCKKTFTANSNLIVGSLRENQNDQIEFLNSLGKLFESGVALDFNKEPVVKKIFIGNYPFQRKKFWFKNSDGNVNNNTINDLDKFVTSEKEKMSSFLDCHEAIDEYAIELLWFNWQKLFQFDKPINQIYQELKVIDKYKKLFEATILLLQKNNKIKVESNFVKKFSLDSQSVFSSEQLLLNKNSIIQKYPDSIAMFALLEPCVNGLIDVLNGSKKSVEIMFPGGNLSLVENVYKTNIILKDFSKLVAIYISQFIKDKIKNKTIDRIRILEIGAGTGGTSEFVISQIKKYEDNIEYVYTDISSGFLQHGKSKYSDKLKGLTFQNLDIEKDVSLQRFNKGSFDLVFASNVLHATRNIEVTLKNAGSLLKKNGVLLLNETTRALNFTTLTFGLADGWWLYEDAQNRLDYAPLIDVSQWEKLFEKNDFQQVESYQFEHNQKPCFQHLIFGNKINVTTTNTIASMKENNQSKGVIALNDDALIKTLQKITHEVSGIEIANLNQQTNLFELGLDSLMLMSIKDRIDKEVSIDMDTALFYSETDTLEKIASYIRSQKPALFQNSVNIDNSNSIEALNQSNLPTSVAQFLQAQNSALQDFMKQQAVILNQLVKNGESKTFTQNNSLQSGLPKPANRLHLRGFKFERDQLSDQQQNFVNSFISRFNQKTIKSKNMIADGREHSADWINSLGFRQTLKELNYPVVMSHCFGSRFVDIDQNEYIDFAMGYGVGFFGNNVDFIRNAIQTQLEKGFELGPQNHLLGKVSDLISELTGVDRVSFCNSGTEAIMVALRLARTATKRKKIVFFAGSYHGTFDGILAFPSADGQTAEPQVVGTPPAMAEDILILPYGDEKSLKIIESLGDTLAGVLAEPVQSRNPSLQPKEFLLKLRALTEKMGAILIFDEVLLGFRIAQGGAQKYFGIKADIVTYGKVVGGGMPIGVVAGKKEVMDYVDGGQWRYGDESQPKPDTTVFQGTFCKHPMAMAAAHAVLEKMKAEGPILQEIVNQLTDYLASEVNAFFIAEKLPIKLSHFGSVFKFDTSGKLNPLLQPIEMDLFYLMLIEKGLYTWEKRICFLSLAHTKEDVDLFIKGIKEVISELKENGFFADAKILKTEKKLIQQFTVSSVQKRLFSLKAFDPGKSPYQLTAAFLVKNNFDFSSFKSALQKVYDKHPLIRGRFQVQKDGEICFQYPNEIQLELDVVEANNHSITSLIRKTEDELNLEVGPAFNTAIYKLADMSNLLVFTTHHSVIDGLSWDIFVSDLNLALQNQSLNSEINTYENYIQWQQNYFLSENYKKDKEYWLQQFNFEIPVLELPTDYIRPARKSGKGNIVFGDLKSDKLLQLKLIAKQNNVTLNMLLLGIYSLLLQKLSQQSEMIIGLPISGRPNQSFSNVMGMFANSIALYLTPKEELNFNEYLQSIKTKSLNAYAHQAYPFERLVEHVVKTRDLSRNPIFDTMFVYEKGAKRKFNNTPFELTEVEIEKDVSPYDLTLEMIEHNDNITCNFEYSTDIFAHETVSQWHNHLLHIINEVIENPNKKIYQYQLWSENEQLDFLKKVNGNDKDFGNANTLTNLFLKQVAINGQKTFSIQQNQRRSYSIIDQMSNGVANFLISKKCKNKNVVIHIERSDNYLPLIIGIMKAGFCFVPVESKFSAERLSGIIDDCGAEIVIVDLELQDKVLNNIFKIQAEAIIKIDANEINLAEPNMPAYIIYTSGSTGKPKGVVVNHKTICNSMIWRSKFYQMNVGDAVLQLASYSFDSSLAEILPMMIGGGTIVCFEESQRLDIDYLSEIIEKHKITCLTVTPSFYDAFLSYLLVDGNLKRLNSVRSITLAGEETSQSLLQKHKQHLSNIKLFNEYGPTENSICGTVYEFKDQLVTIGKPIANNKLFVWNQFRQLNPPCITGQIVLSGAGITEGYLKREELTQKSFIQHNGQIYYLTGDLGAWLPDGNLLFKGRLDDQVKIRGYRIELGEIKSRIDQIPAIQDSVLNVIQDDQGKAIVAYYVKRNEILVQQIKDILLKHLPPYMVPAYFVELASIPLNNSGKVNKKALPSPIVDSSAIASSEINDQIYEGPRSEREKIIVEVWEEILGHKPISIRQNYFHLGGDSIKAIQVMGKLSARGLFLRVPDLFENPTIAQLSLVINDQQETANEYSVEDAIGPYSLTPIQNWFMKGQGIDKHYFNQSVILYCKKKITLDVLQKAVSFIFEKHSVLSSYFPDGENSLGGVIPDNPIFPIIKEKKLADIGYLADYLNMQQIEFDLQRAPLFKVFLINVGSDDYLYLLSHHLIIDVVSWRIILDDFINFYDSILQNKIIDKSSWSKNLPFKKWTVLLDQFADSTSLLAQKEYWQESLSVNARNHSEFTNIINNGDHKTTIIIEKNGGFSEQLTSNSLKAFHTEVNDLLLTALSISIFQMFQINEVVVDFESHGRHEISDLPVNTLQTVGWFTSMYPILLKLPNESEIDMQIKEIKEQIRLVPDKGLGFGVLKYKTDLLNGIYEPLFALNYLGQIDDGFENEWFSLCEIDSVENVSQQRSLDHLVELELYKKGSNFIFKFHFRSIDGTADTWMHTFAQNYVNELEKVVEFCLSREKSELTPADLTFKGLSVEELDNLFD